MSVLFKNYTCVACGKIFIVAIRITEVRKILNVTCPYCGKVGEVNGTEIISIKKG